MMIRSFCNNGNNDRADRVAISQDLHRNPKWIADDLVLTQELNELTFQERNQINEEVSFLARKSCKKPFLRLNGQSS